MLGRISFDGLAVRIRSAVQGAAGSRFILYGHGFGDELLQLGDEIIARCEKNQSVQDIHVHAVCGRVALLRFLADGCV